MLQDVLTLHGYQLREAALIVASPPCQKYSYMAMPWSRAKELARRYRDPEHPGRLIELNALFNACFRIQREASEAAGRHIPMVVENVRGGDSVGGAVTMELRIVPSLGRRAGADAAGARHEKFRRIMFRYFADRRHEPFRCKCAR